MNDPQSSADTSTKDAQLGIVVIGRNEGERLRRCLLSLQGHDAVLVYVDSGSSDDSPSLAERLGATVVALDMRQPFTAARARNAGFARLMALAPNLRWVQFVDGDCQVAPGWLAFATTALSQAPDLGIVCGRRQELHPTASRYNLYCDIEWNTPIGESEACGGDFMIGTHLFAALGGFNPQLIAGEDPEFCYRVRRAGWRILRADQAMTWHDADMHSFRQWARRTSRAGYAYAARAWLHKADGRRYCWRENLRILFWALALPLSIALLSLLLSPWWLLALLIYPLQMLRCARAQLGNLPPMQALGYGVFLVLGKWPECYGQGLFLWRLLRGQQQVLIEYK